MDPMHLLTTEDSTLGLVLQATARRALKEQAEAAE
jgi:hypothetical protein